ncbi:MAG: AAA family ATPase, partial [Petrimonas sp.]|nr:AAA family ATPase [Petrimonas sp.]
MKTVTIKKLRIKNFKGVKDFTLEPNGQSICVFGKNASGKTTIQDAFFYLLFGKDSNDRADFQIKPVDSHGNEIHNIETEVEAVLDVDGKSVTLAKLYKEKWTRKRGSATDQMEGHTTEHFIDGVPVKKKEYDTHICALIDINAFKLVTSPFEFANLHWQARRNMLIEMCGDVSDQAVIESDVELSPLASILDGVSVDDNRAKVKAQQKKINEKLKEIPARIAENQEMVKDAQAPDQKEKDLLDKNLTDLQDRLARERNNEAISAKRIELNEVIAAIQKEQARIDTLNREGKKPILDDIDSLESERRLKVNEIASLRDGIARDEKRNTIALESIEKVRACWHDENAKKTTNNSTCPTCGQELPPDQVECATKAFNKAKAQRLEKINQEGKQLKVGIDARLEDIAVATAKIESISKDIDSIDEKLDAKRKELDGIGSAKADTLSLEQKKAGLESEIAAIKNGSGIRERDISEKIQETRDKLSLLAKAKADYDASEKARARIVDLERQEKALAAEYEALEKELFLTDRFIVRKVEMLESSINSRFKLARFKMFSEQINGGLAECCEILGPDASGNLVVPFDRALNTAARVNTGIDIINTMSEYFQFSAPIFIDGAESVNELADTASQVIGLYVSEDEKLTIKDHND